MIIRHDKEDAAYRALGAKFGAPVSTLVGQATLIHPQWLITAAHAARHITNERAQYLNEAYSVDKMIYHPRWRIYRSMGSFRHHLPFHWLTDLALIRLNRPVRGIQPINIYRGTDEIGEIVTFVGRGATGNGLTGNVQKDGQIRGATNTVIDASKRWLVFQFSEPPLATPLEGISGDGDSGGPAFIRKNGDTFVAGVSSWQDHSGQEGHYGVREYYVRLSQYAQWIDAVIE